MLQGGAMRGRCPCPRHTPSAVRAGRAACARPPARGQGGAPVRSMVPVALRPRRLSDPRVRHCVSVVKLELKNALSLRRLTRL